MPIRESRKDEIIRLADDLVLSVQQTFAFRLGAIVNKAYRLAELAGDEEYTEFFLYEMKGYPATGKHPDSSPFVESGRLSRLNREGEFLRSPAAMVEEAIP